MPRVFISYVRENSDEVQRLVDTLKAYGVDVWFDQTHLSPGDRWAQVIRREIAQGDFFLACFSAEYTRRTKGFVFEELTQAIEQMRQRSHDERWFLPVLLSECDVPDRPIGPGETLRSLHWVELYKDWNEGIQRLLRVVCPSKPVRHTTLGKSIGMEFVLIPAGTFMMGSPKTDAQARAWEKPAHRVTISRPFYLGKYPVTQVQWRAVMDNNPSHSQGDDRPVELVSWNDVHTFLQRLHDKEGEATYRLSTEAEGEYACRAGTTTVYSFGDDPAQLDAYAWYGDNSGEETHPVGQLKPNAWGLYDMHGNVFEWVQDWYDVNYYETSPTRDPQGPSSGTSRVLRGGSFLFVQRLARCAYRHSYHPQDRNWTVGFRVVLLP